MSVIKQISIFNGSNWDTPADIGANAENIDFTYTTGSQQGNTAALSSILPAQALTASRVLVTDSNGKLSSSSISSGILNTALSGASTTTSLQSQINTLNTNLDGYMPKSLYSNSFTLINCTGTTTGSVYVSFNSDRSRMSIQGRIMFSNFVRTGNNPGLKVTLTVQLNKTQSGHIVGYRGESPIEIVTLNTVQGSNIIDITTTETFSNAANGKLTFIIPMTTLYIN